MSTRVWWLRMLLWLFPVDFRELRGAEIEEFVERELAASRGPRLFVSLRIGIDLVKAGLAARFRPAVRPDERRGILGPGSGRGRWTRPSLGPA